MRILLNWKWRGPEIIDALEKAGHEVVYYIGLTPHERWRGVFHHKHEAQRPRPAAALVAVKTPPPAEELIEKLYQTESLVLTMMNRRESALVVDERRHIYYQHLAYWSWVLKTHQIEAVIFDDVPHATNTFVLYSLAKLWGIKTTMFQKIRISDRFLVFTDWQEGSQELKAKIDEHRDKNFSEADLSEDIGIWCGLDGPVKSEPLYETYFPKSDVGFLAPLVRKTRTLSEALRCHRFLTTLRQKHASRKQEKVIQSLVAEYQSLAKTPDWDKPFIYVPFQYQPERTTCPQGDVFVDQLLMVEILSAALPPGWRLYVKEHPAQWHPSRIRALPCVRYSGYYQKLASIPQVVVLPVETDFLTPILKARAVVTVSGSPALEAIFRLKPVLVFGLPWYKDFPELFRVSDVMSCRQALEKIQAGFAVRKQSVINFLKAFDETSFHGYIQFKTWVNTNSRLKEGESMNMMTEAMLRELRAG